MNVSYLILISGHSCQVHRVYLLQILRIPLGRLRQCGICTIIIASVVGSLGFDGNSLLIHHFSSNTFPRSDPTVVIALCNRIEELQYIQNSTPSKWGSHNITISGQINLRFSSVQLNVKDISHEVLRSRWDEIHDINSR